LCWKDLLLIPCYHETFSLELRFLYSSTSDWKT
jgi:hypothetical protein